MITLTPLSLAESYKQREALVRQIERQGIRDPAVLEAMESVAREAFLPPELQEFAYRDAPLPIGNEQTISQPFIVALMTAALELKPTDRVLEIGTGSGYAAAVLSEVAAEVFTVERYRELAEAAQGRLAELDYNNVHVLHGDGTQGWPEHAPYDAIIVAAGGPQVPKPLVDQLRVGGRMVIPVGRDRSVQKLIRVRKTADPTHQEEDLGDVRFVPLVGASGWDGDEPDWDGSPIHTISPPPTISQRIAKAAEPFADIESCSFDKLLDRIGNSSLVLIGEATHGTSEFYHMRARITQELIDRRGFDFVAVEADWPDAGRINQYVQHRELREAARWQAFARFPTWMWRNYDTLNFIEWLRQRNEQIDAKKRAGFYGLDLYSLFTSLHAVLEYLDDVDPEAAETARQRYGCLTPWEGDPQTYGRAAYSGRYRECEAETVAMLKDLMQRRAEYAERDGEQYFDAARNAKLVSEAERYYRTMYYGGVESWNLRDEHMFETLQSLLDYHGPNAKGVVWAHNSHLGDASATEMGKRGEVNVGYLCRRDFGDDAYLIGQATDHGTVAAASHWDADMEVKKLRPSREESYERLCHDSRVERFFLPLRQPSVSELREELLAPRMQRAVGVVYRPQTEVQSHYFHASLPLQFDELIWFDETRAVRPILAQQAEQHPPLHPFALID